MSLRLLVAPLVVVMASGLAFAAHAQDAVETEAALTREATPAVVATEPVMASLAENTTIASYEGNVSFYGREFAGRRTSSGERFDPAALTMAHKTLPFGTLVRVTSLDNLKSVVVRVNDRGPHVGGRIGDLSAAAANALAMLHAGVVKARLEVLGMLNRRNAR